jgi:hypothetical protein
MTYQDFDLSIERTETGHQARVLASPAGEASADFQLPFDEVRLENFLLRLGRTRRATRRVESSELQAAKSFGAALFGAVFAGPIGGCFDASLEAAKREGHGLRVRLRLADAALADLPWEYLYNPSVNRFLALSVHTPLVRYMDLPDPVQPLSVSPPIRVLVMISSPADYPVLDVEAEWKKLNDSLSTLIASGQILVERLDAATLTALQRRLRKSPYHMFHFIGHGEFDQSTQEGVLVLEGENQRGNRVGSQYLGMLLHDASLRVAVLNACEGARSSRVDPFAGSAQCLVQQGIPAVIAMQFEIADDVAGAFAHEFYGALADGYPVDAALTEARKAIFAAGRDVEWGTPVLYLRAPDGRIFDVDRKAVDAAPAKLRPRKPKVAAAGPPQHAGERVAGLLRAAGVALAHGDYADALKMLHDVRADAPDAPGLRDLLDTADQQRAVAETRTARRQALAEHVAAATALLAKADLSAAKRRVADALRIRPDDPEALALAARIAQAQRGEVARPGGSRRTIARVDAPVDAPRQPPIVGAHAEPAGPPAHTPPDKPTPQRDAAAPRRRPAANDESDLLD